jgi:hypothetical protein
MVISVYLLTVFRHILSPEEQMMEAASISNWVRTDGLQEAAI